MNQAKKQKSHRLNIVRIFFDFAVIIVMVWGLYASFKANKTARKAIETSQVANELARESLQNSYIPWLQITSIKPQVLDPNHLVITCVCRNFSNAPALNLDIRYNVSDIPPSSYSTTYDSDALMPNQTGQYRCTVTGQNRADSWLEKLNSGESSVGFDINFKDVFGRKFVVHQKRRCIDGNFRMTEYKFEKN